MHYWLFKSEPTCFGIDDLAKRPKQTEHWDGVRNYQVRNMLRDQIQKGDLAFFYHSSCSPPGIAGVIEVVRAGYPDFTAFDPHADHYDPKSTEIKPQWFMVDVKLVKKFPSFIPLSTLKANPKLKSLQILRKGNRLSITPITALEWKTIMQLGQSKS